MNESSVKDKILGAKSESKESHGASSCCDDEAMSSIILEIPVVRDLGGAAAGTRQLDVTEVSGGRLVGSETRVAFADTIGGVFWLESSAFE